MKKIIFTIILLFFPFFVFAQSSDIPQDQIFKAEVIEILAQEQTVLPDGIAVKQQNLKLRGLEGDFKDREIEFIGIGDFDVIKKNCIKPVIK